MSSSEPISSVSRRVSASTAYAVGDAKRRLQSSWSRITFCQKLHIAAQSVSNEKLDEFFMSFGVQRRMKMGLGCSLLSEEDARETLAIYASLRGTTWEAAMEVLYERCCVLDVHKSSVTACVLLDPGHKRFGCTTRDLVDLVRWLKSFGIQQVALHRETVIRPLAEQPRLRALPKRRINWG
jgi:hypothetical protein